MRTKASGAVPLALASTPARAGGAALTGRPVRGYRFASIAHVEAVRPPTPGPPMQLVRRWDWRERLAAGLSAAGSAAATVAGGALALGSAAAALPAVAAVGGAAALGGAAYLAYRHYNSDERRLQGVRNALPQQQHPVLAQLLDDQLALAARPDVDVHESGSTANNGEASVKANGAYEVRLDGRVRDPHKRTSYLAHELTHVDAQERYPVNAHPGLQFFNVPNGHPPRLGAHDTALRSDATESREVLSGDESVAPDVKSYVDGRLQYAFDNPRQEHDTVVNEVLLYLHLKGVPPTSATYKHVESLAKKARDRRHGTADPTEEQRRALASTDPHWQGSKLAEWEEFRARHARTSGGPTPSYIS